MRQHFGRYPQLASGATIPLSKAVRAGDFVFLSGQLGLDEYGRLVAGGVVEQTHEAFRNIRLLLAEAGASLKHVIKTTVWLTGAADFAAFNEAYRTYFPELPPARSTVISALVIPGAVIEIEVIAHVS